MSIINYFKNGTRLYVFLICVSFSLQGFSETISIDEMYEKADVIAIVDANTVSHRVGMDMCVRHHLGKVKKVLKGDIEVGEKINLGFTRFLADLTPQRAHLVFMSNDFKQSGDLDFTNFEGENLKEKFSSECLSKIKYRFLWEDGRGQILFSNFKINLGTRYSSPYVAQLKKTIIVPKHIKILELSRKDKEAYGIDTNLVLQSELLEYLELLKDEQLK